MGYHDYDWEMQDASPLWRVSEIYLRMLLGGTWALMLLVGLSMLIDATRFTWAIVAYSAVLYYGVQLAMPERRDE